MAVRWKCILGVALLLSCKAAAIVPRLAAVGYGGAGILFSEAPGLLTVSLFYERDLSFGMLKLVLPQSCSPDQIHPWWLCFSRLK